MATPAGTIDISARFDSSGLERDVLAALRRIETKSTISLNTRNFTQPLGKITGLANEFNKSLEASNARVVAFGASAGIIFNIQKAFSSLIKSTIEVEKSLTDINVVLGLSTKGIASFGDQLFDVAKNTGSAFQEVTSAAVEFSRQGLGLEQTLKRTRDALILTRLSGLDVVSSTEALTSAVNSFTKEALTTTDVVNKLAAVDARFAVSSADLSEAIKRVGSSASEAGVSFDELLGIVTSVQQTTARGGAVIGNALKTIFTRIERPEVINDLREFGIAVTDASGNILPTIKVIENLAQSFQSLNPVVKSQVAELVGGVYQINILKAALADVSKENSVFASATSTATKAVDEAILKNEALNKSLSALLNSTTANLTQLASKIGGVSVAPAVRKVLGTINDELTDINDKPAESVGAKIASGLLAGLTNFITGPGIGIGTLVVGKLLGNFTKFATDATKNFLGLNTVGQQQKVIQDETANILARNPQLIQGIISGSKSRLQVEKEIKQILMEQAALSEQIALSSRGMAERMVATGLSVTSTGGLRRSAGGFIPAKDRAAEVMGAAAGGYVAGNVIKAPDSIGGIMNSAESVKYVPGFAQPFILPPKGSKAASNLRNKSLRQVGIDPYLAKGFIPNFASEDQTLRQKNPQTMGPTLEGWLNLLKAKKSNPPKYFIENYEPNMTAAQFFEKVASEKLAQNSLATHLESFGLPKDEVKRIVNQSITTAGQTAEFGGKGRATLFAQTQKELGALKTYVPNAEMLVWRSEAAGPYYTNPSIAQAPRGNVVPVSFKVVPLDQTKISAEKVDIQEKSRNLSFNLLEEFAKSLPLSSEGQAAIAGSKISEYGERTPLAYRQLAGTIFEAGINLVSDYVRDAKNADQGDFDIRGGANIGNLRNFFPSFTSNLGDYKLSDTEDNKNSFLKKIWQEFKKPIGDQYLAETSRIATQTKPEYVNLEVDRRIQEAGSIMAALEKTEGKRAVSAANVPNKFSAGFIPNFLPTNFLKPYRKNLNRIRRGEFNFLPDMRQYMSMGIPMSYYAPAGMTLTDNDTVFINDKLNRKQGSNILAHEMGHSMISNVEGLREKLKTIKFDQEEIKLLQKIKYLPTQEDTGMDAYATNQLAEETIVDPDRLKALASSKEFDSISKKFGLSKKQVQTLLLLSKRYQKAGFSNLKRTGSSYYGNYFLKKIISPDSYANNANVPRKTFNPWLNSGFIPNFSTTNQQTSSPEFKRWFESSKVVNEQGEPLRVYHGTNASFTTFRQAKEGTYGKGIYVTPDLEMATGYTTQSALAEKRSQGGNIMPLYASLKNPIEVVDAMGSIGPVQVLKKLGYTSDKASDIFEKALESKGNLTTQIQKRAELYGHDGIIARYPDGRIKEIVVFRPEQVKSSIGNKGTFNPINPDIRYANGFIPNFAKRDKYKFPKISSAKMEANISKNFEKLSPENRKYFARAYEDYNNLIKVFSKVSGTSPEKFANVMSALSPANPLERNALDALRYNLFAQKKLSKVVSPVFLDEREIGSVKAQTYGANRIKAARLIVGLEKLTGNKRKAFLNNMLDPFGSPDVTVDYRAQGDALNKKFNVKNAPTMNREQYDKVSQAFRNVGIRAGVSGLGVQAATWIGQRMNTKAARGQDFNRGILKFFFDNPDKINLENLEFLLNVPGRGKAKADFFKKASAMGVSKLGSDSLISISRSKGFIPNFAQRISSAGTSLNQIPALFKKFGKELGPRNIDIGGGKYNKGTNFLIEKFGISSRVHDKFNRSQEFNDQTIKDFFGISDTATIANVLNVIEEASEREELLEFTRQSIKPGGSAYFGIYEGNRSGIGADTSKGYQRNLRTDQYLEEISKYFDIRKRIGNYIIGSPLSSGFIPNFATGFNLSTIRFLMKAGGKLSGSVLSPKTLINFASGKGKLEDVIDPFISFLKKPADVIRSEQDLNDARSLIKIIFANPTAREKIARKLAPIISETSFAVDSQVRAIEGLNPDKNDDNQSYEKFLRYRLLGGQAEFEDFNEDGTQQALKKNKDGSYRFNPKNSAGRGELFGIFHTTRALFAEDPRDTFTKSENYRKGARKLGPEENVAGPNPFLGYTYKLGRFIGNLGKKRKAIKYEDRWDVELHDREREILKEYLKKAAIETSQFSFSKAEAFDRIQQEFKEGSYGGNIDSLILRELLSSIPNSKPVVLKGILRIPKDLRFFKGFIPNFNSSADIQKYLADFDSRTVSEFSNKNIRGGTGMSVLLERLKFVKGLLNINPNLTAKELIEILNDRKAKGNNINFTGQSRRFTREDAKRLIARVKNNRDDLGMSSGFIPNFANYTDSVMQLERNLSGSTAILDTTTGPYPFIRNSKQANFADAVADHGGVANALKDSMQMQTSAGLLKNKGFIPNFADFGTTDAVILMTSITLVATQMRSLAMDFKNLRDATKTAIKNQNDIAKASKENQDKIKAQFKTSESLIQKEVQSKFVNVERNLKVKTGQSLQVYDPSTVGGQRLANREEEFALEQLRARRSEALQQKREGLVRERRSIQQANEAARQAKSNQFTRYTQTLGPTAGIVGSQLANVAGSFLPESDIRGRAKASAVGDFLSFAGTGAAFGPMGLAAGAVAGIVTGLIRIKDAKADQAIFDIGVSLDQVKTKSAEFSSSAQGYAVSLEELQRALNDPQSRPEALSRFQKNLSDSLAAIPLEFRDKVFKAGTDLNKVTQAITDINKELGNTQKNLERELSIANLFKDKTTLLNKIGLGTFQLNERDQKLLDRLFASSMNQKEVLKNFSGAEAGRDFETFINDLVSQSTINRDTYSTGAGVMTPAGVMIPGQGQKIGQQTFLNTSELQSIKEALSNKGVLTQEVANQLDTAFEKGNVEIVKSIFKNIAEEGKSLIEAEKRTRLLVEIQKENTNRIKDNEQALKNLNKQYNNLNLLLSNQIDLEKNRASTIREINLIQSEGQISIQRARTKGLLDASAPFITEQQRLDIQGQLDINEITTRGNARIQQAANELLDSFTKILVEQSENARQEIVGLVSDPTTRPQDITRQRNVFQQTTQKLNPLITQSLRDINSGKNIGDIQTDLINQIKGFDQFTPEQRDVLVQAIESSGSKLENQLGLILAETNRDKAIQEAQLQAQKQTLDLTRKLSFAGGAQALATTGELGISQLYDNLSQLVSEFRKTNAIGTAAQRGSTSFKLLDILTNQLQLNRATQAPAGFANADAFNNQVSSDLTNLTAASIAGRVEQIRKSLNLAQRLTEIQTGQPTAGTALGKAFETAGQEAITTAMDQITAEFKLGNMGTYLDALQNEARYLNTLTQQQNNLLKSTLPDNLNRNFEKVITSQVGSKLDSLTTALKTTINLLATQTQKGVLQTEQSNLLPTTTPENRKKILEMVLAPTALVDNPTTRTVTQPLTEAQKQKRIKEEENFKQLYFYQQAFTEADQKQAPFGIDFLRPPVNPPELTADALKQSKQFLPTPVESDFLSSKFQNYVSDLLAQFFLDSSINEKVSEQQFKALGLPASRRNPTPVLDQQISKQVTDLSGTYEGLRKEIESKFGVDMTVQQIKDLRDNNKELQNLLQNPLQIMNVPTAKPQYGPLKDGYAYGPNVVPAAQNQAGELNTEIPDYLKTSRAAIDKINQALVARASITKDMSAVIEKVNTLLQQQTLDAKQEAELLSEQVKLRQDVIEQDSRSADYLYRLNYEKKSRAYSDTFFREEKAPFADAEIRAQARKGNLALGAITQKNLEYTRIDFVKDTAEMIDEFQVNFKSGIGSAFGEAIKGTKSLQDAFRDMFQNLLNRMLDKSLQMGVDSLFAFGKAAAGFKNGGEIKKYNSGGMVTGGSGNKDDVLTMMRGGEFVIKKSSVNKYGSSYLEALNQQTIPTAADGGFAVGPLQNEFLYLNTPERPTSGEYAVDSRLSAMALTDENNPQNRLREQRFEELDRYLQDRAQFERDKDQAMKMYEKQVRSTFYSGLIAAGTQLASAGLNVGAQNLRLPKTATTPATNIGGQSGIGVSYNTTSIPEIRTVFKAKGGYIPRFASGGQMNKGGMPALLMGGEYVMNRDAVKNYGTDFMSRLNSGTLPRYAQGGSIGGSYTTSQTGPQSQSNSVDDLVTALNTLNENLTKTSNITQSEAGKAIGTVSQESGMSVVNNISISMTPAGEVNSQVQSNTTQGTTTSQNDQNSAQNNAKLAEILRAKVVEVLVEQKRPGGLLYRS